ncbi:unnamed protein product [Allacma fusca]|uniref:Uncharacterized protein n=1 Tax=Allacma fusca TaxID=39272 RepID=A0A8J2L0C2_9HEXA|nr:unnamed protein product [Allacma fusca]
MEDEIKKRMEEDEEAKISGGGNGLYTLCPTDPGGDGNPDILISNEEGEIEGKINSVIPRVIYTNYPKTEEERVNLRRDMVIQMIVAEGGGADFQ